MGERWIVGIIGLMWISKQMNDRMSKRVSK